MRNIGVFVRKNTSSLVGQLMGVGAEKSRQECMSNEEVKSRKKRRARQGREEGKGIA